MRTRKIQFDGDTYVCRIVKSNEGEDLIIGSTKLLDTLHPGSFEDENEGFASKEAEQLYNEASGQRTDCRTQGEQPRMVRLRQITIIIIQE